MKHNKTEKGKFVPFKLEINLFYFGVGVGVGVGVCLFLEKIACAIEIS